MACLGSECAGRDKPMNEPSRHFAAYHALGHVGLVISITGVINCYLATSKANVQSRLSAHHTAKDMTMTVPKMSGAQ
ncbi:hypothetical protein CFAM422_001141 [Trichoderma lentiforme]|uniref:Uncharacterized protein n=1 Tax=Trichoderma lentiforme TaxID=1567552 RepID=A0A9P4XPM4_9HYPO|nr:hypothetical protein CFAM422_001141 [Trichoderma lentiforme]